MRNRVEWKTYEWVFKVFLTPPFASLVVQGWAATQTHSHKRNNHNNHNNHKESKQATITSWQDGGRQSIKVKVGSLHSSRLLWLKLLHDFVKLSIADLLVASGTTRLWHGAFWYCLVLLAWLLTWLLTWLILFVLFCFGCFLFWLIFDLVDFEFFFFLRGFSFVFLYTSWRSSIQNYSKPNYVNITFSFSSLLRYFHVL